MKLWPFLLLMMPIAAGVVWFAWRYLIRRDPFGFTDTDAWNYHD
jgi:hypothetical protein